jgi:hypothetical protein
MLYVVQSGSELVNFLISYEWRVMSYMHYFDFFYGYQLGLNFIKLNLFWKSHMPKAMYAKEIESTSDLETTNSYGKNTIGAT